MANEYSFLRVYKNIANQTVLESDVNNLYSDLFNSIGSNQEFNKWFDKNNPVKLDKIISIDAVAHEIHAGGNEVLQKVYPGADIDIFKSELDKLAGMEKTNDVRKLNRGFFTTLLSDDSFLFLEKQQVGRTTKDDIYPAIEEYKRLYDAGIGSKGELLTLDRYYNGQNKKYHDAVIKQGLDKEENEPMVIGGPASLEMVDKEGHLITAKALDNAFSNFMKQFRTRDIQLAHTDVQVGWPLQSYITKNGSIFQSGVDDKGLWLISELRDDTDIARRVSEQIKAGVFKSYSIAGSAKKTQNVQKGAQNFMQVDELSLQEVTICLTENSKVWTLSGLKNIQDIKGGEFVLTHQGRFKPVLKVFKRSINEEIAILKTDFGLILEATKEHPVLVREEFDGEIKRVWNVVKNLIPEYDEVYMYDGFAKNPIFKEVLVKEIALKNYAGNVYNLEVEEDNSYTTEACVVHNCERGVNQGAHFDILKSEEKTLDEIFKKDTDKKSLIVDTKKLQKGNIISTIGVYDNMNALDAFKKFMDKNYADRQKEHRKLLDEYGFPEDKDVENPREDTDDEIYHHEPWTTNAAGQHK